MTIKLTPSSTVPVDSSGSRVKGSNLTLMERANADGTLRVGYDTVVIPNGATQYWQLLIGSAPDILALTERFLSQFEDSGLKYRVLSGVTDINTTGPITRLPTDPGISWTRISTPSDIGSATELDYTTIPKSGVGSGSNGGVIGFEGLRKQPNDFQFVLSAENLSGTDTETHVRLQWIKTTDPNYF